MSYRVQTVENPFVRHVLETTVGNFNRMTQKQLPHTEAIRTLSATRIRVKNPAYTGKLLEEIPISRRFFAWPHLF